MISQSLLSELKIIFLEDYGIDLPPKELSEVGTSLVGMFELLAKMVENGRKSVCFVDTSADLVEPQTIQGGVQS